MNTPLDAYMDDWFSSPTGKEIAAPYKAPEKPSLLPTCVVPNPPHFAHQLEAYAYMQTHPDTIIHLAMRGGKCRIIIDFIANKPFADMQRVLIVCPKSVIPVWEEEFAVWSGRPAVVASLHTGSVAQHQKDAQAALEQGKLRHCPTVCVINYGAFWRKGFGDWAMLLPWDVVVYDECHALCGANSKQSKYAARFYHKARYRFGLTGTPLPKAHASVYPLYRALDQTLFGTSKERHEQRYFIMGGFNNTEIVGVLHATEFRAKVNAIRFYVPAKDLKLPPVVESTIPIILPPAAWRVYTEMQTEYYAKVKSGEVTAANAAVASIRLRQITSGFLPVDQGPGTPKIITTVHTAKEDALRDFLESLPPEEPVVVFCHFKYDLAAVHSVAKSVHRFSSELSGSVKTHDAWKQGKTSVIACQLQAAAEGINLSRANYVVYYSLDFHWQHLEQSRERVRVHGKTDSIGVYHLTVRNSVDARIRSVLSRRGNVIEELLRVPLDIHN